MTTDFPGSAGVSPAPARDEVDPIADQVDLIDDQVDLIDEEVDLIDEEVGLIDDEVGLIGEEVDLIGEEVDLIGEEVGLIDDEVGLIDDEVDLIDDEVDLIDDEVGLIDDEVDFIDEEVGLIDEEVGLIDDEVDRSGGKVGPRERGDGEPDSPARTRRYPRGSWVCEGVIRRGTTGSPAGRHRSSAMNMTSASMNGALFATARRDRDPRASSSWPNPMESIGERPWGLRCPQA